MVLLRNQKVQRSYPDFNYGCRMSRRIQPERLQHCRVLFRHQSLSSQLLQRFDYDTNDSDAQDPSISALESWVDVSSLFGVVFNLLLNNSQEIADFPSHPVLPHCLWRRVASALLAARGGSLFLYGAFDTWNSPSRNAHN